MTGCRAWLAVALGALAIGSSARASESAAPDEELLEFLGSIDAEDAAWIDYLMRTDLAKIAKREAVDEPREPSEGKSDE